MPSPLPVRSVLERSLRKIGAYSMMDTGADPDEMEEAGFWLDIVVSHLTATNRRLWLVPATITLPLTAQKIKYTQDELKALDPSFPANGLQFPHHATVSDGSSESDVEIIKRLAYDDLPRKDLGGKPTAVYIDRQTEFDLFVHPVPQVPTQDNPLTYTLKLVGQRFNDQLSIETNSPVALERQTELRRGWDLWAVLALSAEIGDGPIRKLPGDEVERMNKRAAQVLQDLSKHEDEEHDDEFHRANYVDL